MPRKTRWAFTIHNYYLRKTCPPKNRTMRILISLITVGINALFIQPIFANQSLSEQAETKRFIQAMYTHDPAKFEHGNFKGKYSPQEHCKLLREYFNDNMIKKTLTPTGETCDIEYLRYPTLSSEDVSIATRIYPIPKPSISPPAINNNKATISVITGGRGTHFEKGRSLFFLTKTENGWRISNTMIHFKWPDLDDGANNCHYKFARRPTAEEKGEIPSHCK